MTGKKLAALIYEWANQQGMHPDDFNDLFVHELLEKMEEES